MMMHGLANFKFKNSCLQQFLDQIHKFIFSFFDAVYILTNSKKYFNYSLTRSIIRLQTHSLHRGEYLRS